jgi:hypothetical protein
MRTILFFACLGGAYGILYDGFGMNPTTAGLVAWPVGIALYFVVVRPIYSAIATAGFAEVVLEGREPQAGGSRDVRADRGSDARRYRRRSGGGSGGCVFPARGGEGGVFALACRGRAASRTPSDATRPARCRA